MAKHHTRNTVSTTKYCKTCGKMTPHQVSDRREGHCLACMERKAGTLAPQRPMGTVYVDMPCECDRYPFGHFHVESKPIWGAQ